MKWLIGIAIILMSAVIAISLPFKQKDTLTWDAVTTNVDGTPAAFFLLLASLKETGALWLLYMMWLVTSQISVMKSVQNL